MLSEAKHLGRVRVQSRPLTLFGVTAIFIRLLVDAYPRGTPRKWNGNAEAQRRKGKRSEVFSLRLCVSAFPSSSKRASGRHYAPRTRRTKRSMRSSASSTWGSEAV